MEGLPDPGQIWSDFTSNPVVQLAATLIVVYVVMLWLGTAYWAFRDMQARTENPILPYFASPHHLLHPARVPVRVADVHHHPAPRDDGRGLRALAGRGVPPGRDGEAPQLSDLSGAGVRGLDRVSELPDPAAPDLPRLPAADRAGVVHLRLLRHRAPTRTRPGPRRSPPPPRWTADYGPEKGAVRRRRITLTDAADPRPSPRPDLRPGSAGAARATARGPARVAGLGAGRPGPARDPGRDHLAPVRRRTGGATADCFCPAP